MALPDMATTNIANANPALASLADIIEPDFTSQFALAPIYWLLIAAIVAVIGYAGWKITQRHRYWFAKRQAIKLLAQLEQHPAAAKQINQLLKRVLQHYQPAHPALSASSEQWQQWLAKQSTLPLPNLSQLLYQADSSAAEVEQFYIFARQWLTDYKATADTELVNSATTTNTLQAIQQDKEQQHA